MTSAPEWVRLKASGSLEQRWWRFHKSNPQVADRLLAMARAWRATGRTKGSIKTFMEVLRWEDAMTTTGDLYKLNNSWSAFYSRHLLAMDPSLDGLFELRRQRSVD